jgi:hypothetical protein
LNARELGELDIIPFPSLLLTEVLLDCSFLVDVIVIGDIFLGIKGFAFSIRYSIPVRMVDDFVSDSRNLNSIPGKTLLPLNR